MCSFPNFEPVHCSMSDSKCCFVTCKQISQETGQVVWYSQLLKNFPQFVVIYTLNMPANLENSAVATGLEKVSFHSNPKECSNYHTIALISHASKVMLKILQARLQQYVIWELPDIQAGLRNAKEPEIKLPTSAGSWKKQESSRKTSISALLIVPKPLTV